MKNKKRIITGAAGIVFAVSIATSAYVFAAPSINLTTTSSIADSTVNLNWSNSDTTSRYTYRTTRSVNGGEYNGMSATSNEKIKVLNIHPSVTTNITFTSALDNKSYTLPKSASLKMWMEQANAYDSNGYGRGLITVDAVSLATFNASPATYLSKDANGKYKYDVIMFGTWDSNNSEDITTTSLPYIQNFINAGGGTIFGHDTINQSAKVFGQLASTVNAVSGSQQTQTSGSGNCEIEIVRNGTFTTYPWNIGGTGTKLIVPQTHAWSLDAKGDIWLRFTGYDYDADNFYLTTNNNVALIQTGHSSGAATDDEQKILANLIFYLADLSQDTSAQDKNFKDINAPNKPTLENNNVTNTSGTLTVSALDVGTTYDYRIEATEQISKVTTTSNTSRQVNTSGIKGYSYVIDSNPTSTVDNTIDSTTGNIEYTVGTEKKYYLHIKAIDNAGNVGPVLDVLLHENVPPTMELNQDITEWTNQNVTISAIASDIDGTVVSIKKADGTTANGSSTTQVVSQNGTYEFIATDSAGDTVTKTIKISNIDKVNPNGTYTIDQPTAEKRYAQINFSAEDDASGVAKIVKPDGSEETTDSTTYRVTIPGIYTFVVYDVAGNSKEISVEVQINSDGIEVKYVDVLNNNEEISSKVTKSGLIGDSFTANSKEITGYELVTRPENETVTLTMDKQTLVYEYKKLSDVYTRAVDANSGEELQNTKTSIVKQGDNYTTQAPTFNGYQLVKTPENANGTMEREDITATYEYKKISAGVDIRYIDDVTGELLEDVTHLDGLEKDTYESEAKDFDGYLLEVTATNPTGLMTVDKITVEYR